MTELTHTSVVLLVSVETKALAVSNTSLLGLDEIESLVTARTPCAASQIAFFTCFETCLTTIRGVIEIRA